jgi:transcriptional regulator GlxA family with amidase domain
MVHHLVLAGVADGALGIGLDVFATAARLAPRRAPAQRVISVDGRPVRTWTGRALPVDGALRGARLGRRDVVLLPGLAAATPHAVEALLARADTARALPLLARAAERGATIAASCSATTLLAAAGLLDGVEATTTWWLAPVFARRFPGVTLRADRMVVDAGRVVTAGAAFAHADLALALVARLAGAPTARLVARYLVVDERPSQARYMVLDHLRSDDAVARALERFVMANLARQVSLAEMARATGTSPRTLARRVEAALGTTPQRFAQRLRAARAAHLLETTTAPVEAVAADVGYADAAAFRRVYRRYTGEAPRDRRTPRSAVT